MPPNSQTTIWVSLVVAYLLFLTFFTSDAPSSHALLLSKSPLASQQQPASAAPSADARAPVNARAPTAARNLQRHLHGKKFLVVQTDNRLDGVWQHSLPTSAFSGHPAAASVLDVWSWANSQGYAYLFLRAPPRCFSADGKTAMASYWYKVPAMLYALRMAQRASNLSAVLILDTDVSRDAEHTSFWTLEHVLESVRNQTSRVDFASGPTQIVFTADPFSFWVKLLWRTGVYKRGAINSGGVLLKRSARAFEIVSDLWCADVPRPSRRGPRAPLTHTCAALHVPAGITRQRKPVRTN
jgi:hypothetical protein